jgi:hypothetical protein
VLPRRFRSSAPWAPAVRVGLPPAIVPGLRSDASYIVTLVALTAITKAPSYPQMVFIGSDGTSAWGMTLNRWTAARTCGLSPCSRGSSAGPMSPAAASTGSAFAAESRRTRHPPNLAAFRGLRSEADGEALTPAKARASPPLTHYLPLSLRRGRQSRRADRHPQPEPARFQQPRQVPPAWWELSAPCRERLGAGNHWQVRILSAWTVCESSMMIPEDHVRCVAAAHSAELVRVGSAERCKWLDLLGLIGTPKRPP